MNCGTDQGELADALVGGEYGLVEDAVVAAHVQAEQVVVDQPQGHVTGHLGRQGRDLRCALAGLVVQVVLGVQVGAVVGVGLGL